ncbi:hypothetical protein ACVWYQ_006358 [Bradyrhizobium sp. USDA 3397]
MTIITDQPLAFQHAPISLDYIASGAATGVVRPLVLIFCFVWLACGSAQAEKRVALVIGNSAYKSVPQLPNPANDAALVGDMFRRAGFDLVETKNDLNVADRPIPLLPPVISTTFPCISE